MKYKNLYIIFILFLLLIRLIYYKHQTVNFKNEFFILCNDKCSFDGGITKINSKRKIVTLDARLLKSSYNIRNELSLMNRSTETWEKLEACYELLNCTLTIKVKKPKIKTEFIKIKVFATSSEIHFHIKRKNFLLKKISAYLYNQVTYISKHRKNRDEIQSFIKALLLGVQDKNFPIIRQKFIALGISHLIVISGLHLSLIYLSIRALLKILFMFFSIFSKTLFNSFVLIECSTLCIVLFYKLILPESIPLQRATIMLFTYSISKLLPFKINSKMIFLFSIFILIFISPISILTASFYLSYISVLALITLSEIKTLSKKVFFISFFLKILSSSILIFIFSFALNLFLFKSISLLSPLLNIIFIPLTFFLIVTSILTFGLHAIIGYQLIDIFLKIFLDLIDYFYSKKLLFFIVNNVTLYETIIYFIGIILICNAVIFKKDSSRNAL